MNLRLMQLKVQFKMFKSFKVKTDKNTQVFFALLRAGLWEKADANLDVNEKVDWEKVYQLAEEQSVVGLVLAGIERYKKLNLALHLDQELLLQWIGEVQMIEQQNKDMNDFVAKLIEKLRKEDVYAILVKGQGIAQCYERPLWRASGDVDLLLNMDNYEKAKKVLIPLADGVEQEYKSFKHIGMTLNGEYVVELHGTMHSRLSKRIDRGVDEAQNDVFFGGSVRSWQNGNTSVFLPSPDNDVIFVFTHILHHFYIEGIGLRQICDWCRLLYRYRSELDLRLLESRIRKMGLISEWKAFYNLANRYLGMPDYGEGLMVHDSRYDKKADRIMEFVLETGNFGHNRERTASKSYMGGKLASTFRKLKDFGHHMRIFPIDSVKFFCYFAIDGIGGAMRGE